MRSAILTIAAVTASLYINTATAQTEDKLPIGSDVPSKETVLRSANGKATSLKSAMGQNGLLVMFSCNTCPFVIRNQPITKKTAAYATAHHVGMVIINSNEAQRGDADSYEAMEKYAKGQNYTVPYLVDENSKFADLFGANHTPEVFLFNANGKLVYKGAMNDNPSNPNEYKKMYIEDAINAVIAGKTPDPSTTRSVGCSIKRKA